MIMTMSIFEYFLFVLLLYIVLFFYHFFDWRWFRSFLIKIFRKVFIIDKQFFISISDRFHASKKPIKWIYFPMTYSSLINISNYSSIQSVITTDQLASNIFSYFLKPKLILISNNMKFLSFEFATSIFWERCFCINHR
jgi:hypothetical protein